MTPPTRAMTAVLQKKDLFTQITKVFDIVEKCTNTNGLLTVKGCINMIHYCTTILGPSIPELVPLSCPRVKCLETLDTKKICQPPNPRKV